MNPVNERRNSGIDLVRIISMLMVIILHILLASGILEDVDAKNYNIAWLLETLCLCAVNCYALIFGYLGVANKFKISSIIKLWCQVTFYTVKS